MHKTRWWVRISGMELKINTSREKKSAILSALVWGLAWTVPWGNILVFDGNLAIVFLVDMFKLGLSITLFIVPGILLYILLESKENVALGSSVLIGIVFSVLLISALGLLGRVVGLSFEKVKIFFWLIGLGEILLFFSSEKKRIYTTGRIIEAFCQLIKNIPLVFAVFLVTLMMFHDSLFFVDDYTYLSYLTSWQHADPLSFKNIVHEMDVLEFPRYWLALLPMSQALLGSLSGIPGLLLLGNYLELYLVFLAVLSLYWIALFLGVSQKRAGLSVLFQISLYAWMIYEYVPTGYWFYLNMSEDKVFATFLIFPSLLFFSLKYIEQKKGKNLLFVFLSGMAMVLTHPVIFVFSVFIILLIALIALFSKQSTWRNFFFLAGNFGLMMLPHFLIRLYLRSIGTLSINATNVKDSFEAHKVVSVLNDVFYGLAPNTLLLMDIEMKNDTGNILVLFFRFLPVTISILAFFIAFEKIREGHLYWYIFASVFLTIFATLPYTGWILGYFVSGRMISRASWFLPLGLGIVLIWQFLSEFLERKKAFVDKRKNLFNALIISFLFVSPVLFLGISARFAAYFESMQYYRELAQVGSYIDQHTDSPVMVIALDYKDTQFLPGVSSNARLISFRERKLDNPHNNSLSVEEIKDRIYASNTIQKLMPSNEYCNFIEDYDLKFVLADEVKARRFQDVTKNCMRKFKAVFTTDAFLLLSSNNPK
ncbi:MAG: hypothetical protein GY755_10410 [Chloroflexi bacterium]|nr:hypothetical protein [Chloroflexota bacterium]